MEVVTAAQEEEPLTSVGWLVEVWEDLSWLPANGLSNDVGRWLEAIGLCPSLDGLGTGVRVGGIRARRGKEGLGRRKPGATGRPTPRSGGRGASWAALLLLVVVLLGLLMGCWANEDGGWWVEEIEEFSIVEFVDGCVDVKGR